MSEKNNGKANGPSGNRKNAGNSKNKGSGLNKGKPVRNEDDFNDQDELIDSEERSEIDDLDVSEEEEDPDQKRLRMAKQILAQAKAFKKTQKADLDEESKEEESQENPELAREGLSGMLKTGSVNSYLQHQLVILQNSIRDSLSCFRAVKKQNNNQNPPF